MYFFFYYYYCFKKSRDTLKEDLEYLYSVYWKKSILLRFNFTDLYNIIKYILNKKNNKIISFFDIFIMLLFICLKTEYHNLTILIINICHEFFYFVVHNFWQTKNILLKLIFSICVYFKILL